MIASRTKMVEVRSVGTEMEILVGGLAMARKTALVVEVSAEERKRLEAIVRKRTAEHRLVQRARIIVLAAAGRSLADTARRLGMHKDTVAQWRRKWRQTCGPNVAHRLADEPRPGAPAKFTAEQICAIMALACEPPSASARPITQWSQNELAEEAVKRGIVAEISQRSVGRFLKSGASATAP